MLTRYVNEGNTVSLTLKYQQKRDLQVDLRHLLAGETTAAAKRKNNKKKILALLFCVVVDAFRFSLNLIRYVDN